MAATWPASLPQYVDSDGYAETAPDVLLRTQMDAGPAKVRRRFTAGVRLLNVELLLTSSQVDTLETFYTTTLTGGADPFDWVHPRTQAAATYRFRSPPAYRPVGSGVRWIARLELEILP